MELSLRMLGTGSAFAKKYYNTNAMITCNGYCLLLDCGHTAPKSLYDLNICLDAVDGIFITHLHEDHIGGLEEFAFRLMYEYKKKITLFVPEQLYPALWENSLKGNLENRGDRIDSLEHYFHVVLLKDRTRTEIHSGLTIETIDTLHIKGRPSYSVILNDKLFYSADVVYDRALLERVYDRGCTTMLHDCQLRGNGLVHATLEELLTLPEHIQSIIYLMHYEDGMEQFVGHTGKMQFIRQHQEYRFAL